MRLLLIIVLAASVLWSGYWFVGARGAEVAVRAALAAQTDRGYLARAGTVAVTGFPNRFDLTLTDIALGDPRRALEWSAPFAQVLALSYQPNNLIVALPPQQNIRARGQNMTLVSQKMQASLLLARRGQVPLQRGTLVADAPELASAFGWAAGAARVVLASERLSLAPETHRIGAEITGLRLDAALLALADPEGELSQPIERLHLDATVTLADAVRRPDAITLTDASLAWGSVAFVASGKVAVGPDGTPEGTLALKVRGWRELLRMGIALGFVPPEYVNTLTQRLQVMAAMSGDADEINLPLSLRGGMVVLGVVPLMPAPRLTF